MFEALGIAAAIAVAFFLAHFVVRRVFGVSLLCHLGLHRWHKLLVGQGRDTRYVVKCKGCEILKDDA
jgi:hypothetical protein